MEQFIKDWGYVVYILISILVYVLFVVWANVKDKAWQGIISAKRLAKEGVINTGVEQENFAVQYFYPLLPGVVKGLISEAVFRDIVKWLYSKAKDLLDDGCFNGSCSPGVIAEADTPVEVKPEEGVIEGGGLDETPS